MNKRVRKGVVVVAGLVALALGGSAFAAAVQNQSSAPQPAQSQVKDNEVNPAREATQPTGTKDTDNVQSGDQSGADGTSEASDGESGSEVAGNDGPGGHADEPGNPNADHQATGQE
jgi:cytoskeletal protein RodZ